MSQAKFAVLTGLAAAMFSAALFVAGCNKNDSTTPSTPGGSTATPGATPTATTGTPSPAAVTAMSELAGTYNAVSDVEGHPGEKRHQTLTLNTDGTATLATTVGATTDNGTGVFTAGPKEVTATFSTKDGKPVTPAVMKLTRDKGDKALLADDGRTFERAK